MKLPDKHAPHVAVLDADRAILAYVRDVLADRFHVSLFTDAAELSRKLRESPAPDLLLMDWQIAEDETEENALGLLRKIRASKPSLPVIIFACSAELKEVATAMRIGAADIILKPFRKADIDLAVQQCLEAFGKQPAEDDVKEIPLDESTSFVRSSERMQEIEAQCKLVARTDIPVLILGESGTGKEVAAKLVHKMSARSQLCFLKVNCVAMPADLLESELFGYEQGAFTGAVKSKPGKFEVCNGGTIFLDEIGEMPPALQAKLLQVLQDGTFSRLGGRSSVTVDVRVIAATNVDMKEAIANKTFREDLYYRLNGFAVKMPPLRERAQEIPILAQHFLRKAAAKYQCDPLPISSVLMQVLATHAWPGNVRELENTIKRYLVLGNEQGIVEELSALRSTTLIQSSIEGPGINSDLKHLVRTLTDNAESAAIAQSLRGRGWNRKATANDLQISYKALLYKIKRYNLSPPDKSHSLEQA
ncbi:MAG: sigma-54-dependent transcriptional regulator [Acidobacteriaceae bacterium]